MKPTVVWEGIAGLDWGRSWIERLLSKVDVDYNYVETTKNLPSYDKCIVVTNNSKSYNYIKQLQNDGKSFGVILLSDECLSEPMFYLEDPNCKFAARTYFHPWFYGHPKVFIFGLGYKQDFEKYTIASPQKTLAWSFAGSLKMDRSLCLDTLNANFPNSKTFIFEKFADPTHLDAKTYAELLSSSTFVPCPQGGAILDSFRIYEALEANSIPVTLNNGTGLMISPSYWHGVFHNAGQLPFVCEGTWEDVAARMKEIVANGREEEIQLECKKFWVYHVAQWQTEFKRRIELL